MTTPTALSNRTPEEVFTHHGQAFEAEDLDAILLDYALTATIISPPDVLRGKDAIRTFFTQVIQALPKAQQRMKMTFADNVLLLEWTADFARASVSDGVETYLFENGLITLQTVHYTVVPKA
jgi:ketosteroid isomerase-like protein